MLALTACATPTTGVLPLADGLHKVIRSTNAGALYDAQQLKAEAVQEATDFCTKAGKQYRLVDITQRQPRALGGWPEGRSCSSASDGGEAQFASAALKPMTIACWSVSA